ncbi:phosphatase PAP2 family protein [Streptosporangium roseum]|uniref:Phosphoesterase PA-phosphatase related protein n=1 Tax=Streptosporangium roseum (strain ATCC 12428 / DSM 43021 / JCM 3005 / KCTC 9067 / NCIMB 10171 / NRRL 2505 / NI 9100) TaxID=479432 RepID=D2B996_STRRD|nr:phosphatase PAP2 family protein [Streptosporangium roseum]ACZ91641.1 phosphoesterase PA-phosphatase related protein [Streptosporangium roseum DSM 43021]
MSKTSVDFKGVARLILLPLAIMAVLTISVGLLITKVLQTTTLIANDQGVNEQLVDGRTAFLNDITDKMTKLSDMPTIIIATAVLIVVFRLAFKRWNESIFLLLAVFSQSAIFLLATVFSQRKRPLVQHLDPAPPTSSFPSGHTSAAVGFYCAVALVLTLHTHRYKILNVLWWAVGLAVPLGIAYSRMYRGMHHLSDVSWGLLLGAVCIAVAANALLRRRPVAGERPVVQQKVTA